MSKKSKEIKEKPEYLTLRKSIKCMSKKSMYLTADRSFGKPEDLLLDYGRKYS